MLKVSVRVMHRGGDSRHVVVRRFDPLALHRVFGVELVVVRPVVELVVAVVHLVLDVGAVCVLVHHEIAVADILPFVVAPAPGVHEEVAHGRGFESELASDRHLHLL